MDKMKFETADGAVRNVDKIAAVFPQVVTERKGEDGKITRAVKWDVLKELLSGEYVEGGECYDFTWPGKRAAIAEAAKPIRKTLRPCKEESKDWDTTQNLYIEGDNLEVLKLLQESYLGKAKMIYIDPPYNTGNDFIYEDDFKMSSEQWEEESGSIAEDEETGETVRMFKNTESNGRFHSDWCSMIYIRLALARDLLADDGVIFISIDDNEIAQLRKICDEIFGGENFVTCIEWQKRYTRSNNTDNFTNVTEHIVVYAKNTFMPNLLLRTEEANARYSNPDNDPRGPWKAMPFSSQASPEQRPNLCYEIVNPTTKEHIIPTRKAWRSSKEVFEKYVKDNLVWWGKDGRASVPSIKRFLSEARGGMTPINFWDHEFAGNTDDANAEIKSLFGSKVFDTPKPTLLLMRMLQIATDTRSVVIDFFSGGATTAHAVMKQNAEDGGKRKFIMVQLPEVCAPDSEAAKAGYRNICEIGKERIRRAGEKIKEEAGLAAANLDVGFRVFKVADSNMKDVHYSADKYSQETLDDYVSNIKEDRTDLYLLYGCLLDWGVELSLPHTSEKIDGVTVHTVNNGDLVACFDQNIPESAIRKIAKRHPLRAVFRDSSFAGAPQKINVEEIFKLLSPTTTIKVI